MIVHSSYGASRMFLLLAFGYVTVAFSSPFLHTRRPVSILPSDLTSTTTDTKLSKVNVNFGAPTYLRLRGGQVVEEEAETTATAEDQVHDNLEPLAEAEDNSIELEPELEPEIQQSEVEKSESSVSSDEKENVDAIPTPMKLGTMLSPMTSILQSIVKSYATSLNNRPILTKSATAYFIFGLSDYTAQRLEQTQKLADGNNDDASNKKKPTKKKNEITETKKRVATIDWTRTLTSAAVGLFYFGPAAHYWYETIFRLLPGTSLISTLQKALLGQMLFGPSFTCLFFATFLIQSGTFTFGNWFSKIKKDLPGAWLAGAGFWPLVDLVSYSLIAPQWIPLFVNMCSFVWTIYLSTVANRRAATAKN